MWSLPFLPMFVWAVSNLPSQSTDLHVVFTGDSKLAIGVAVSMHGCLFFFCIYCDDRPP